MKKEAVKVAATCRGSISIIHEDKDRFAVNVININPMTCKRDRGRSRKGIKNITARKKTKQNKIKQKKQHTKIKERWKNHHLLANRPRPIKAGQDVDVAGPSPEKTSPLLLLCFSCIILYIRQQH
jgi:hypothetical protein